MKELRIVFMGSADLSCASLEALCKAASVVAVVTQPDRPKGRHLRPQASPVKILANAAGIPVLQPERARDPAFLEQLRPLAPDLIVVAAFGQILPQAVLDLPRWGCLNVHTSLLPKYRGAAPIQRAILEGETETGVTLMKMDAGLDTGGIVARVHTAIAPEDDAVTLYNRLARLGAELLVATIPAYVEGAVVPVPQPSEGVSYAAKIRKEDGRVDWSRSASMIWNQVRGLVPWPGAFCFRATGEGPALLKLWRAQPAEGAGAAGEVLSADRHGIVVACGQGALRVQELQREGGKRLSAEAFLAGTPLKQGERLT